MKILFIVPYMPNLVRVRPYQFIRSLSKRGHEVTVATLWVNDKEKQEISALKPYCQEVIAFPIGKSQSFCNCLVALLGSSPLQSVYSWQPMLAQSVQKRIVSNKDKPGFDIVHVEHLRGVRYGLHIKLSGFNNQFIQPVVWDSVDSISHLFRQAAQQSTRQLSRWITRFELRRTERYEAWLLSQFEKVIVTSPKDKEAFCLLAAQADIHPYQNTTELLRDDRITVIPNGVDLEFFSPGKFENRQHDTLVISGKMSYHANTSMVLYFAQKVFPLVLAQHPQAKLVIAGKDPPGQIKNLMRNPAIQVTGEVQDMRPYIQTAAMAVAPVIYGAGIQNKVLEAMACATPVVATPQAVSALNTRAGVDLEVAASAEEMASIIITLLQNPQKRKALGEMGRCYVETHHTWDGAAAQLEAVYHEAIKTANKSLSPSQCG